MKKIDSASTDIVFVVLHYMVKTATIKCISKIREKIDTLNYKIVIVDNASSNGSGKELEEIYKSANDVTVIINEKNLGFARGNNVGFRYAKEKMNPKYIVLLNNDVYIMEAHLKEKLDKEYKKRQFAVLGPLIMTKDGECNINPMRRKPETRKEIVHKMNSLKRALVINKLCLWPIYYEISKKLHDIYEKKKNGSLVYKEYTETEYNVQLHGCFLIFSEKYIEKYDGLDDRTFLYGEESILYKHMLENGLITVYAPDIIVYHEEAASTIFVTKGQRKKLDFTYKNMLEGAKVLLKVYDEYEQKNDN